MIQNLVRKDLCDIYISLSENIGIIFKEANVETEIILNIQKTYYVLIFDYSESISGKLWNYLMKLFFLNKLLEDQNLKYNSWIIVINYNENFHS